MLYCKVTMHLLLSVYQMYMHFIAVVFSSPEPKAHGELIVYQSSRRLSVCLSGCLSVCLSVCSHFQT